MPTPLQIKLIHLAVSQAKLTKDQYRTVLRNSGGVESSKDLDQAGFEDCMAVIEDCGFRERDKPADYWRAKVIRRGHSAGERMVRKILALGQESRYEIPALCLRFSGQRTSVVEELGPREAWMLIEMLKASNARNEPGLF